MNRVVGVLQRNDENGLDGILLDQDTSLWLCISHFFAPMYLAFLDRTLLGRKVELIYPINPLKNSRPEKTAIRLTVVPDDTPNCSGEEYIED